MPKNTPIDYEIVKKMIKKSGITNVGGATIREIRRLVANIEQASGNKYIKMEMGIPGLPPPQIGTEAEIEALKEGVAAIYPSIEGYDQLKIEIAKFVKNFMDIDVTPNNCFTSVGSIHGCFSVLMVAGRMEKAKDTVLFIDPGFPVHKQIVKMIGLKVASFDVYNYRGKNLRDKLESCLKKKNISTLLYSNPNNPTWICFTEKELKIIAELAEKYDVLILEDLAYFAMDFRRDLSGPGKPPFQPTVARYTDNYIIFVSSSKIFSYAGQRVGMLVIPDKVANMEKLDLLRYYPWSNFGHSLIFGTLYATTAGVGNSAQHALATMLHMVNKGEYDFIKPLKEYGDRARIMKQLFINNGFKIVYDQDEDEPLADGFYFTISYPGLSGEELIEELLYYGISAISLTNTGSQRSEGIRACVSFVSHEQFPELERRLKIFKAQH